MKKSSTELGWLWVRQDEIAEINPAKPELDGSVAVSFIPMGSVEECSGKFCLGDQRTFGEVRKGYTSFRDGDLLFAKITPCMENGKVALVRGLLNGHGAGSTEFHVSRISKDLDAKFYFYYLVSSEFRKLARSNMTGSAGQLRVPTNYFKSVEVPLCSYTEQRRIVAKIEALFSEIDHGVEELKAAQKKLKRARQALLKAAFEGKLTARWRAENPDKLEGPEALRRRIQAEREAYQRRQLEEWDKAVEEWRASGNEGRKPRKPKALKVTNEAQIERADGLPETWLCAVLGNLYVEASLGKMLDKEKNKGELRPYLRNVNVRWGKVVLDDVKKMRFEDDEKYRYSVVPGDLVICEGGEPGRCAVWKEELGDSFMIQKALHRVRFGGSVSPTYIMHYLKLCTDAGRISHLYTGTTIKHLTGKALENVPIPLCGMFEQEKVVEIIESRLSEIDQMEDVLQASLQRAESLKQSILKQAFSGRLVPQDPDDEPASELLARIRAEREAEQAASPRRRRGKKAEATP